MKNFPDSPRPSEMIRQAERMDELIKKHHARAGGRSFDEVRHALDQASQVQHALRDLSGFRSPTLDTLQEALTAKERALKDFTDSFSGIASAAEHFRTHFSSVVGAADTFKFAFADLQKDIALASSLNASWPTRSRTLVDLLPTFPELEALTREAERYEAAIQAAPDEATRRETVRDFFQQATEGWFGVDLSPQKRIKLFFRVLHILCTLLATLDASYQRTRLQAGHEELRRIQREHSATLTLLAETVRSLQEQLAHATQDLRPVLRVRKKAILRAGPSSNDQRIAPLPAGTHLRLITSAERWYYVELVAADGGKTGVTGWIYRRNVKSLK